MKFSPARAVTGAVGAVFLLAAYVRLYHPELTWFSVDQARDAQAALDIVGGRSFPRLGVELTGGPGHTWGPAYFYLIAIPFAVSRDPALAVAFLGAMGLAGLILTYRFAGLFFGRSVAVLSVALISTYPLAVIESKALWNVSPVPLLAVVFFHALFSVVVHRRSVMIIPALAMLGLLLQFHLSAVSLVIVLPLALVLFRPPVRALHLGLGIGLMLALLLPYLLTQGLTGFQDLRAAASASARLRLRGPVELAGLAVHVLFASPDLVSGMPALQKTWRPDVVLGLHRLEAWSLVAGLVFVGLAALWPFVRPRRSDAAHRGIVLAALGFAVPFVMLGARADILPHYFDVTYPLPFIAAALAVSRAVEWVGARAGPGVCRAVWSAVAVAVAATMVSQVDFHRQLWRTIRTTGAIVWAPGPLELMPIRYEAELTRILVTNFGVRSTEGFDRLHGSLARDLSEAKGYFFPREAPTGPARSFHYAIVRDDTGAKPVDGSRVARAGPYTVVEYLPLIEYSTWKCADRPGGLSEWTPVRIPTASGLAPTRRWRSPTVTCQGAMSASGPRPLVVVVSLRATTPGDRRVEAFLMNGVPVSADRLRVHSTFIARAMDIAFDVGDHLRPGTNALALRVFSDPPQFDLDVHEIGR